MSRWPSPARLIPITVSVRKIPGKRHTPEQVIHKLREAEVSI